MNKKRNIIIILVILILFLVLAYFIFFNKDYTLTVYNYKLNDKNYLSISLPKDSTLIDKYDIKCKNKCELLTFDYDSSFFAVKNKKEGYIYDINTKNLIDVGSFDKLNTFSLNKNNNSIKIGYLLTKQDNIIQFIDYEKQQITIPWTKDYKFVNSLINNEYLVTEDGKDFVNIHTGKVHKINKSYEYYACYTLNTCVFYIDDNNSFIYNFDEEKTSEYAYKVLINYETGSIIEKDNKIYNLDFKTNETTYIMDKLNFPYNSFGNYLYHSNYVDKDELLLNFFSKEECKSYIYNITNKKLSDINCTIID